MSETAQIQMDAPSQRLCLEVAWEIDALARVLPGLVPSVADNTDPHFVVRAMAGRLLRLSRVLIATAEGEALDEIAHVVDLQEGQG